MNSKAKKWMLMVALVAMVAAIGVGFSSRIYAATKKTTMVKRIEVTYNKNLRIKNGSYCSGSLLRKLKLDATAIGKEGRRLNIPVVIREYGTYFAVCCYVPCKRNVRSTRRETQFPTLYSAVRNACIQRIFWLRLCFP